MVGKLTPGVTVSQVMTSRQQRKYFNKSQTLPPTTACIFSNDALQVIPERVVAAHHAKNPPTNSKSGTNRSNAVVANGAGGGAENEAI